MRHLLRTATVTVATAALVLAGQTSAFAGSYTLKQGDDFARVTDGRLYVQDKECDFHTAYVRVRAYRLNGDYVRSYYGEDDSCHGDGVYPQVPLLGRTYIWRIKVCETHPGDDSCTSYYRIPTSALD